MSNKLFTFGREHEKKCAIHSIGSEDSAQLLLEVIDHVHDFIDGSADKYAAQKAIELAFTEGTSGIWEPTGNWLIKLCKHYPQMQIVWIRLSKHKLAKVRFRTACFLDTIPMPASDAIATVFLRDKSKKVQEMAEERVHEN